MAKIRTTKYLFLRTLIIRPYTLKDSLKFAKKMLDHDRIELDQLLFLVCRVFSQVGDDVGEGFVDGRFRCLSVTASAKSPPS